MVARLNCLSIDVVMEQQRLNTASANHAVAHRDLSADGRVAWDALVERHGFDSDPFGVVEPVTMSYCLQPSDPRRMWLAYDSTNRAAYPIWWDPNHEVSGDDGRRQSSSPGCDASRCFHYPDAS
ncbi:hypothetical protein [Janibacter sp. G368]|uniref:hypothetical protein n=1 Tax=Janibacter sp. G368 TaxID=3420441 RepID=UPI003D007604